MRHAQLAVLLATPGRDPSAQSRLETVVFTAVFSAVYSSPRHSCYLCIRIETLSALTPTCVHTHDIMISAVILEAGFDVALDSHTISMCSLCKAKNH